MKKKLHPEQILNLVCNRMKVPRREILNHTRRLDYVWARQLAMRLMRDAGHKPEAISKILKRTPAAVYLALQSSSDRVETDKQAAQDYEALKSIIL